jgi:DNA polymerase I-like protein with 3'-5' exonuclease and polymerase domains
MKIAYDMSAWLWNSLLTGRDTENGFKVIHKEKEHWINSRHHGYDICLKRMVDLLDQYKLTPIDMIMVFEGDNSKHKRLLIDKNYKQGREHPDAAYKEFLALRDEIKKTFLELGAQAMTQDFAEGDDTLAWLAENMEEDLLIATFDNDIAALNGANGYGARVTVWINGQEAINKYGLFEYHEITTYKALVGDSSDNIKGCVGFGPGKFEKLIERYGYDGLSELHTMLSNSDLRPIAGLDPKADPLLHMIAEQAPEVIRSFDLAKLRPEWVNSKMHPLRHEAGMVRQLTSSDRDPRLKRWYGVAMLVTASSFKAACVWALPLIVASKEVALDIETSTPEESTDWLERKGNIDGVDVFGSELTGLGLTFGRNNQYTLYFTVDHADSGNIASEDLRQFIAQIPPSIPLVIQNTNFELPVLQCCWGDKQLDNGYDGYLPNVLDTKLEASYVDENKPLGLKQRSLAVLGYKQQSYDDTTLLTDVPENLPRGGRLVKEIAAVEAFAGIQKYSTNMGEVEAPEFIPQPLFNTDGTPVWLDAPRDATPAMEQRRYKMNELSANHVFGYGADDPICTIALHNHYKLVMQLEHTWKVYLQVEIGACYANAKAFVSGIPFSMERMIEIEKEDQAAVDKAWPVLREFLISKGWEGTVPPVFDIAITAAQVKGAFEIVTGRKMDTMMRTVSKLAIFASEKEDQPIFGELLARLDKEKTPEALEAFTKYVLSFFKGDPDFNSDSPTQMKKLMYETMALPVRLSNKLTEIQRAKGEKTGTPKTDDLAIQHALHFDKDTVAPGVLEAIQTMKQCGTRNKLYYKPYRNFPHWSDGLLHPSTNQCATVTRRNSASDPNYTQWPAKGDGLRFRECIVARGRGRVVISSDASGQELRLVADLSRDANMLSCYIGESKKDIHSIVAAAATKYFLDREWSYEEFYEALKSEDIELADKVDALRTKSKTVNFGEIYGMMAKALAAKLMISEEEAQSFLDAKKAQFPGVDIWKDKVVNLAHQLGYSLTMLGARRHLRDILVNGDSWEVGQAERQLSNFEIQSSGAEAIKIALGKVAFSELMRRCDVHILGSIHDELVLDCPEEHAFEVARELVKFLEAQYANMIVPFVSETTIGLDFGHQLKLPYGFNEVQMAEVLKKMHAEADKRKEAEKEARALRLAA